MANAFDQLPPHTETQAVNWFYAGFWWRLLAWSIDTVVLSCVDLFIDALGLAKFTYNHSWHSDGNGLSTISNIAATIPNASSTLNFTGQLMTMNAATLIAILVQLAYFTLLESSRWQGTIGKRVCHIRVTGLDGGRISQGRALGRNLGKYLSALILGIGFLMVALTRRKQGLHDMIADTLVIRRHPPADLVRFNPPPR